MWGHCTCSPKTNYFFSHPDFLVIMQGFVGLCTAYFQIIKILKLLSLMGHKSNLAAFRSFILFVPFANSCTINLSWVGSDWIKTWRTGSPESSLTKMFTGICVLEVVPPRVGEERVVRETHFSGRAWESCCYTYDMRMLCILIANVLVNLYMWFYQYIQITQFTSTHHS